jgi:hypothetical protein
MTKFKRLLNSIKTINKEHYIALKVFGIGAILAGVAIPTTTTALKHAHVITLTTDQRKSKDSKKAEENTDVTNKMDQERVLQFRDDSIAKLLGTYINLYATDSKTKLADDKNAKILAYAKQQCQALAAELNFEVDPTNPNNVTNVKNKDPLF